MKPVETIQSLENAASIIRRTIRWANHNPHAVGVDAAVGDMQRAVEYVEEVLNSVKDSEVKVSA